MNFEVYCDESRQDIPKNLKLSNKYMLIGGIWIKAEKRNEIKNKIKMLKNKYKFGGEIKWKKVCKRNIDFFKSIIDLFLSNLDIRFRCIVIDKSKLDFYKYHNKDIELGFYKFYYQMLNKWIYDYNNYKIFIDLKTNRIKNRIKVLEQVLNNANLFSEITVQALPSREVLLIQLTDFLLGLISTKFNYEDKVNINKKTLIGYLETKLGKKIEATNLNEKKVNIFVINLNGGW